MASDSPPPPARYGIIILTLVALGELLFLAKYSLVAALIAVHFLIGIWFAKLTFSTFQNIANAAPTFAAIHFRSQTIYPKILLGLQAFFAGLGNIAPTVYFATKYRKADIDTYRAAVEYDVASSILPPVFGAFIVLIISFLGFAMRRDAMYLFITLNISILISIVLRHILYRVTVGSIPKQLKQREGRPIASFLALAFVDFVTLVLALTSILHWPKDQNISFLHLLAASGDLLLGDLRDLGRDLFNLTLPTIDRVMFALVGALFALNVLESVVKIKDFRRNDDDYCILAQKYVAAGRYADALNTLLDIKGAVKPINFFSVRASAYLGVEEFELALSDLENNVRQTRDLNSYQPDQHDLFVSLSGISTATTLSWPMFLRLIQFGLDKKVNDASMAIGLEAMLKRAPESIFSDLRAKLPDFKFGSLSKALCFIALRDWDNATGALASVSLVATLDLNHVVYFRLKAYVDSDHAREFSDLTDLFQSKLQKCVDGTFKYITAEVLLSTLYLYRYCSKKNDDGKLQTWEYNIHKLTKNNSIYTESAYFKVLNFWLV